MENFIRLMTEYWFLALILIGVIIVLSAKKVGKAFGGETIEIKAVEAVELLEQQHAIIIDLAEKTTFEKGHIPGAINMPGVTFINGSVAALTDNTKPVILIPMKGLIPMPVVQHLESEGVPQIYILKGGLNEWTEAGLPL